MSYSSQGATMQCGSIRTLIPESVVPATKWLSFGLLGIDAAVWIYALAEVPRQLLGG